jgi:two-component system nitrogen regulation response regulator GlnG
VRELRNIVIRLTAKFPGQTVSRRALEDELDLQDDPRVSAPLDGQPAAATNETLVAEASRRLQKTEPFNLDQLLAETERNYIEAALRLAHGNVSQAARLLGINRTTLYNRMEASARGH